nr:hypothetical protein [Tanacetum cinerariifolium]
MGLLPMLRIMTWKIKKGLLDEHQRQSKVSEATTIRSSDSTALVTTPYSPTFPLGAWWDRWKQGMLKLALDVLRCFGLESKMMRSGNCYSAEECH